MRKSALYGFGLVVTCLVALGLIVLSSASEANGIRLHNDAFHFMTRQFLYLAGGIAIVIVAACLDYHFWRNHPWMAWTAGILVLALLVTVFAFKPINGSRRWISLGFVSLQPSEIAKLMTVILTAVWLDLSGWRVELFWKGACVAALMIAAMGVPVMLEPDFGSTMVIGAVGIIVMFISGVRILHLLPFIGLGGAALAAKVLMNANRMARIAAWLGIKIRVGAEVMDAAAKNAEHQGRMALAAIGNGGIWGVGLNNSMQKHAYLPEAHTDMIFAIGAEELGLFFSIAVLGLFIAFFACSYYIATHSSDRFGRYLVAGMAFIIFFQAMFNLGVVCEALPMKGMALPFFSYGGTNLWCSMFAVGTILSVGIHSYRDTKRKLRT